MPKFCEIICLFCFTLLNTGTTASNLKSDDEIRKAILRDYDKSISPSLHSNNNYTKVYFVLTRLRGINEKKGEFILEGLFPMVWMDQRLLVNGVNYSPGDIPFIRIIRMNKDDIWVPTLHIYNWVEPAEITLNPPVLIYPGIAFYDPSYTLRTSCDLNFRYYPFDTQVCDIVAALSGTEGDILPPNFNIPSMFEKTLLETEHRIENFQWIFKSSECFEKIMNVDSDIQRKVFVYRFVVQRSMPLIPLGILTPCISCVLLLLTTFWMPAGSSLRSGISITSMLVSSTSLFSVGKLLPVSGSSTPIIVEYVAITLILSAISSIQTILTSVIKRCEKPPPVSYATIIHKFPRICLLLLGISTEQNLSQQLKENYLFSELDDPEDSNISESEMNPNNIAEEELKQCVQSLWLKHILLFDRVMFYVLGIIIVLFIISVIITE